jgi:poly(3-hydroxybutyrate) depolymerase
MQLALVTALPAGPNPLYGMPGAAQGRSAGPLTVKTFWTNEITSKDLVYDPLTYEVDVSDVPEGRYVVQAEILDGTQSLDIISTPVTIVRDLTGRAVKVEQKLARVQGHESAKASARFPFNLARAINGWRRQTVDNIDLVVTLKEAETLADQLASGNDPLYQSKGDHKRHYWLAEAGEILPYRIYVPAAWDGKKKLPMVVNLHGGGDNEDSDFDDARPGITAKFSDLAEQYGMIVVVPSAYRPSGGYGASYGLTPAGRPTVWPLSPAKSVTELSELDIIKVMDLVSKEYNVDASRTYLVGNSMGGGGVWHIGTKYAERFAAIAPCASSMDLRKMPTFPFERLKNVPTIAVVGEFDADLRKAVARYGVAELNKRGYTAQLIEVKGGNHGNAWRMELPAIFKFFAQYQRAGESENGAINQR